VIETAAKTAIILVILERLRMTKPLFWLEGAWLARVCARA
jgi:hypothetical protein